MKKIFALILAVVMVFSCFSVTAYAEVSADNAPKLGEGVILKKFTPPTNGTRGTFNGYNNKYVTNSGSSSFTVTCTGLPLVSAGLTFKTSCDSDDASCVIDIKRPNGGWMVQDLAFGPNQEDEFTFYFPTTGTYTITYTAHVPNSGLYMQCWIYG